MSVIYNLLDMRCKQCNEQFWAFIKSIEERENFKCDKCLKIINETKELPNE